MHCFITKITTYSLKAILLGTPSLKHNLHTVSPPMAFQIQAVFITPFLFSFAQWLFLKTFQRLSGTLGSL